MKEKLLNVLFAVFSITTEEDKEDKKEDKKKKKKHCAFKRGVIVVEVIVLLAAIVTFFTVAIYADTNQSQIHFVIEDTLDKHVIYLGEKPTLYDKTTGIFPGKECVLEVERGLKVAYVMAIAYDDDLREKKVIKREVVIKENTEKILFEFK